MPFALVLGEESQLSGVAIEYPENDAGHVLALAGSLTGLTRVQDLWLVNAPEHNAFSSELSPCMTFDNKGSKHTSCDESESGKQQSGSDSDKAGSNSSGNGDESSGDSSSNGSTSSTPTPASDPSSEKGASSSGPPPPSETGATNNAVEVSEDPLVTALMDYLASGQASVHEFWSRLRTLVIWVKRNVGTTEASGLIRVIEAQFTVQISLETLQSSHPSFNAIGHLPDAFQKNQQGIRNLLGRWRYILDEIKRKQLLNALRAFSQSASEPIPGSLSAQVDQVLASDSQTSILTSLVQHFAETLELSAVLVDAIPAHMHSELESIFNDSSTGVSFSNSAASSLLADVIVDTQNGTHDFLQELCQKLTDEQSALLAGFVQLLLRPQVLEPKQQGQVKCRRR